MPAGPCPPGAHSCSAQAAVHQQGPGYVTVTHPECHVAPTPGCVCDIRKYSPGDVDPEKAAKLRVLHDPSSAAILRKTP